MEQQPLAGQGMAPAVSWKAITRGQALSVSCPACGAAARRQCELRAGGPRSWPHRARLVLAAEKLKAAATAADRAST